MKEDATMTRYMPSKPLSVGGRRTTLLACLSALVTFAIGGPAAAQTGSGPIRIGAVLATTGGLAPFGTDARPAIELFVEQLNAKGGIKGRPLEVIYVNDESKPELALAAVKRLTQQEKVTAIIGPVSQQVTSAASPVIEESKTPALNCSCFHGPISPYIFSTFPARAMTRGLADIAKAHGGNSVGIMAQAGALADTLKKTHVPDLQADGVTVAAFEQFQPSDTDLTPVLARLRSQGIKIVYVAASGTQAALAAKNFKQLNYPGIYWTFTGNANQSYMNLLGEAADVVNVAGTRTLVYKSLPDSDPSKQRIVEFANAYKKKTDREPGTYAAFFYDSMTSLADGLNKAGDDREKLRDALENQKGLQVLNGTINRSKNDHNGLDPVWLNIGVDSATKAFFIKTIKP